MSSPTLTERMAEKSESALREMLMHPEDWTPEALQAARDELTLRNVDITAIEIARSRAAAELSANRPFVHEDLLQVAKWQKMIIWMILLSIGALFIPWATLVTGLVQMFFIYKLARSVRSGIPWLYIALTFVPFFGLLGILHLNGKATGILKAHGIKVGLMGARGRDLQASEGP